MHYLLLKYTMIFLLIFGKFSTAWSSFTNSLLLFIIFYLFWSIFHIYYFLLVILLNFFLLMMISNHSFCFFLTKKLLLFHFCHNNITGCEELLYNLVRSVLKNFQLDPVVKIWPNIRIKKFSEDSFILLTVN